MATIALPRPILPHRPSSDIATLSSPINLEAINTPPSYRSPVPNKHLPVCPAGPAPAQEPNTPPPSPAREDECHQASLLYPPDQYSRLELGPLTTYELNPADVAAALDFTSRRPVPEPSQVFPWYHGLHPRNELQGAFFVARLRTLRRTPSCLRGVTLVKADGNLTVCRLKGAIAPREFLHPDCGGEFVDVDPKEGFSVRNFHIQSAKAATTSDIVIYGEDAELVKELGWQVASAQSKWRERHARKGVSIPTYNTFVCVAPFEIFQNSHDEIVSVDSNGRLTGSVVDLLQQERIEMRTMSKASEISHNVWMGPTPAPASAEEQQFDIMIECSDMGRIHPFALQAIAEGPDDSSKHPCLDFPSSGSILPPTWSLDEAEGILETCKWIWHLAYGTLPPLKADTDEDEEITMVDLTPTSRRPRKVLIHCADGYTESTLLGIAYFSYSTGRPVPDAWLDLHTVKKRNFFAYPADVALLTALSARLLQESPVCAGKRRSEVVHSPRVVPKWIKGIDGSLPSRILDYMYLGNLAHANNLDMLRAMGIGQILSVGEAAAWNYNDVEQKGLAEVKMVRGVQDNGIDSLLDEFDDCLDFIDRGRRNGTATLVHCRVGVSRSATICIAQVMRSLQLSLPRAYCYVRARRLNVIIQPHLRFIYELLTWDEVLHQRRAHGTGQAEGKREMEWAELTREIAMMNRPYVR